MSFFVLNYAAMLKFENNIKGRARLWDTALKFLSPVLRITSLDHMGLILRESSLDCLFWEDYGLGPDQQQYNNN